MDLLTVKGFSRPLDPALSGKPATISGHQRFENILKGALDNVNSLQENADSAVADLASGKNVDLHGTMIALEKADISLRTMATVREKFVRAYETIMNMAI